MCGDVLQPVGVQEREVIVRMRNSILCLAQYKMMLYDTSVYYAYEASSQYQVCLATCLFLVVQGIINMNRNGNFCKGTRVIKVIAETKPDARVEQ